MRSLAILALSILLCTLTACLHHPDVQQGNIISAKTVTQLRTGMSRQQVEDLLGSPVLTQSFTDRLTYVYSWQSDESPYHTKSVVINFSNGRLANYKMSEQRS